MKQSIQVVSPAAEIPKTKPVTDGRILRGVCNWRNLNDENVQAIIQLRSTGATLNKIGATIGCSGTYASSLIRKIKAAHGDHVFERSALTISDAAEKLGVTEEKVRRICTGNEMYCSPRKKGRQHYITSEGFEILRTHPLITRKQICEICGGDFTLTGNHQGKQKTCSKKCKDEYSKNRRAAKLDGTPSVESLVKWHRILYKRIQYRQIPPNETWLAQTQAARHAGLSNSQVWWLRACKIVTIKLDDQKKWRQTKPVSLYAASEMKSAGEAFREYQRTMKKPRKKIKLGN